MNKPENGYVLETVDNRLSLNMNEEAFADILLNFLGKKESLEYFNAKDKFKVKIEDLVQLDASLKQKIEKEQFTKVENLNITVEYNDFTSHSFNGIGKLSTFDSLTGALPISITLTWEIILKIPTNKHLEKQKISLSFNSLSMSNDKEEIPYYISHGINSFIKLDIEFTNQAWGVEVLNLVKFKIGKTLEKESKPLKIAKVMDRYFLRELIIMFLLIMSITYNLMAFLTIEVGKSQFQVSAISKISELHEIEKISIYDYNLALYIIDKKNNDLKTLSSIESPKVKNILKEFIETVKKTKFTYNMILHILYIALIFGLLKLYTIQTKRFYKSKSFILITDESIKIYEDEYNNNGYIQYLSIVGIIVGVVSSLIATLIYDLLIT